MIPIVPSPTPTPDAVSDLTRHFIATLESYHTFTIYDLAFFGAIVFAFVILRLKDQAPTVAGLRDFVNVLDSRGGNILLLALFSAYGFTATMRLFYVAFALFTAKALEPQNAVLLMALQFCTTSVFAGSFGAMLKTMSGNTSMMRAGESANGIATTTSTVITKSTSGTDKNV